MRSIVLKKGTRVYCDKCGKFHLEIAKNIRKKEYESESAAIPDGFKQSNCECGGVWAKNSDVGLQFFTYHGWQPRN